MLNALKQRYWALRSSLKPTALRRRFEAHRERGEPARYARRVRYALFRARLNSQLLGFFARPRREKRLLYLAWLFPPIVSGGVYRPTALFKYGAAREWRSTVLAGPVPEAPSSAGAYLRAQIPSSVEVHHLAAHYFAWKHPDLPQLDGGMLNALNTYWRAVNHCRSDPPGLIVASGPPFHNFFTATLLARRFRARLVLEYRDEWSESPFEWVDHHPDNRRLEGWSLSRADLVIFTTESQLDHQLSVFPCLNRQHCRVLPNGWDPADFPEQAVSHISDRSNNKLVLAFLGNFGSLGVPETFLSDLAVVLANNPALRSRLELHLVGQKTDAANAALDRFPWPDSIKRINQVPKPEACKMMVEAQGLLLLNPPELARYIPGKLFEYIATGTKVLLYGDGGEVGAILKLCKAGFVVAPGNVEQLANALNSLSVEKVVSEEARTWLARHTREHIAKDALEVFSEVLTGEPTPKPRPGEARRPE